MRTLTWFQKTKILWMVLFHRRTPLTAKATIAGGLLYGLLPFDLIPDFLPILGMADDATFLIFAFTIFLHLTKSLRKEMERRQDSSGDSSATV